MQHQDQRQELLHLGLESTENYCSPETAKRILNTTLKETRKTLAPFNIPIYLNRNPSEGDNRPYFDTSYNVHDIESIKSFSLEDISIVAYEEELLEDSKILSPYHYNARLKSGFKEETIHCVQILSAKKKFARLPKEKKEEWENACQYYNHTQQILFNELANTKKGRELLIASARLYYANPNLKSIEEIRKTDKTYHREGYITVELSRQIIQVRLGEATSEENKHKAWDRSKSFGMEAHRTHLLELNQTIRLHAPEPRKISPLLEEIIQDTEELIKTLNKLHTLRLKKEHQKLQTHPDL